MNAPKPTLSSWKTFALELAIYASLLVAYFFLVLHFLGGAFKDLFDHNRTLYAVVALVVMLGQAVGLEVVSSLLTWAMAGKKK